MAPANTQFAIAVHIMAVLGCHRAASQAEERPPVTSSYLAASVNATPSFIRRVLAVLSKANLVKTVRGPTGCCSLQKPPEEISILEIYRAVDAPKVFALHSYPPEERCTVSCRMSHVMESLLTDAQKSMEKSLAGKTLAELVSEIQLEED